MDPPLLAGDLEVELHAERLGAVRDQELRLSAGPGGGVEERVDDRFQEAGLAASGVADDRDQRATAEIDRALRTVAAKSLERETKRPHPRPPGGRAASSSATSGKSAGSSCSTEASSLS